MSVLLDDRIASKIDGWPLSTDECWHWTGAGSTGVPHLWTGSRSVNAAGEIFFLLTGQRARPGARRCQNGRCVNPYHRDPQHSARALTLSRHRKGPTPFHYSRGVCKRGHPIRGRNVSMARQVDGTVGKRCRICMYRGQMRYSGHSYARVIAKLEAEIWSQEAA